MQGKGTKSVMSSPLGERVGERGLWPTRKEELTGKRKSDFDFSDEKIILWQALTLRTKGENYAHIG